MNSTLPKNLMLIFLVAIYPKVGVALDEYVWKEECNKHQQSLNRCSYEEYLHYETQLNVTFSKQITYLTTANEDWKRKTNYETDNAKLLIESQKQWTKFRDADCKYVSEHQRSGSIYGSTFHGCLAIRTRERIIQLEQYLACRGNGCPI